MTNNMRRRRGFTTSDSFHRCKGMKEDTDHIMRICPNVDDIWRKITPKAIEHNNWKKLFAQWLSMNLKNNKGSTEGFVD